MAARGALIREVRPVNLGRPVRMAMAAQSHELGQVRHLGDAQRAHIPLFVARADGAVDPGAVVARAAHLGPDGLGAEQPAPAVVIVCAVAAQLRHLDAVPFRLAEVVRAVGALKAAVLGRLARVLDTWALDVGRGGGGGAEESGHGRGRLHFVDCAA